MERVVRSRQGVFDFLNFGRLWESRTAIIFLLRRDVLVSYKQTLLGVLWNVLRPVLTAAIIVFVFQRLGEFPDFGIPYFLLAMSALIIWESFTVAISWGSVCFTDDRNIITKMNFPRVILPFNAALRNTIGFVINLLLTLILMAIYGIPFLWSFLLIPLVYVSLVLFGFAAILWLSTINVYYRDIQAIVPFVLRIGLFISPVGFTFQSIPEAWRLIYSLNPLVAIIESMRYCLFGDVFKPDAVTLFTGGISMVVVLCSGLWLFGKYERRFADVL